MQRLLSAIDVWFIQFLLVVTILWRGGKSLDAVWLLAIVSCGLTIVHLSRSKSESATRQTPMFIWVSSILLLLWTVASYVQSSTLNYGLDEVLQAASLTLILFWSVAAVHRSSATVTVIFRTIAVATFLATFIGIVMYISQPVDRMVGSFFDYRFATDYWPNAWAEFLLLVWPTTLLLLYGRSSQRRLVKGMVMGILLGCLLLSYSRGAILSLAIQCLMGFVGLFWIYRGRFKWKLAGGSLLYALITAAIVFFVVNDVRMQFHPVQSILRKATFTADEGASSISERSQFWQQAVVLAKQRSVFGWGPYSFRFLQPQLQTDVLATADHPHNVILKLAMERGLLAAALFMLIIITVLWKAFLFFATATVDQDDTRAPIILALSVAVVGVLAHNMIDYNLQFVGIALPFTLFIGFIIALTKWEMPVYRLSTRWMEIIIAILLMIVVLREGAFLMTSSLGRRAQQTGQITGALQWYALSADEWFSRDMLLSQADLERSQQHFTAAESTVLRYLSLNAFDGRAWRLLGDIQLDAGDRANAMKSFSKAFAINKYNDLGSLHGLLTIVVMNRDRQMADSLHADIDALLTRYVQAIKANVHFIALSQNVEDVEKIADLLATLYPESAGKYRMIKQEVNGAAAKERASLKARSPGLLW